MKICVTGHRPNKLWGYDLKVKEYIVLKQKMREFILSNSYTHFISGMALGVDILFALTVLELKNEFPDSGYILECAIPCENQYARWNKESITEWKSIVENADIVTYVSKKPYDNYCMQNRNKYMVNNSDCILAVWNGTPGGTANCIKYAKSVGKQIFNIY
jgi:uncharacterized phage-like protein YoqJ